ncbi:unnamed protein product [Protopolystoma xenopodis]|uniref:EGF-like domain-containing protein n=1 Tax=Protopolystoma xenopodis TaxID=117903 RepID=A0A3S5ADV3_9PLAT|nr:unnamed protein product [Protopolystoma xenopodis]
MLPIQVIFDPVSYIGGGRPQIFSYQGCLRRVRINSEEVVWSKLDVNSRHADIINGSCMIQDRCNPNPCKHEAPCTQTGNDFFCDCSKTGYGGAVCHQSEHFTSCSEVGLFYSRQAPRKNITIDLDGSGVLEPIEVQCDFTDINMVQTHVYHSNMGPIVVDGYQEPGSYRHQLSYSRANRETLGELVRRALTCEQAITYRCWNSHLLRLPTGGMVCSEESTNRRVNLDLCTHKLVAGFNYRDRI